MQGILVVSFGTSFKETREKNITAIENEVEELGLKTYSAFTSNMIRRKLAQNGEILFDVEQALLQMKHDKITDVLILPTHLLYGFEFEKIVDDVNKCKSNFNSIEIAKPLLGDTKDMIDVINIINDEYKQHLLENEAIVLMGHGTEHYANSTYPALDYIAKQQNCPHIFITTVEGYPNIDIVINQLKQTQYNKVLLLPLMLVAGDHAINDMASDDDDSLKSILSFEGFKVRTLIKGLGEYPQIRQIYLDHLKVILGDYKKPLKNPVRHVTVTL